MNVECNELDDCARIISGLEQKPMKADDGRRDFEAVILLESGMT